MHIYGYEKAQRRCRELGLPWNVELAEQTELLFARIGLTQEQVNALSVHQCHLISWLFSPRAYSWRHRLAIALHFIIGRR